MHEIELLQQSQQTIRQQQDQVNKLVDASASQPASQPSQPSLRCKSKLLYYGHTVAVE